MFVFDRDVSEDESCSGRRGNDRAEILAISVTAPRGGIGNPNRFRDPMQSGGRYIHALANITKVSLMPGGQLNLTARSSALLFLTPKCPKKFVGLKYGPGKSSSLSTSLINYMCPYNAVSVPQAKRKTRSCGINNVKVNTKRSDIFIACANRLRWVL